jgi:hypothetical protein
MPVLFYVQNGVERSGVRSTLLLNASLPDGRFFEEDSEVLKHIQEALLGLSIVSPVIQGFNLRMVIRPRWATDGTSNFVWSEMGNCHKPPPSTTAISDVLPTSSWTCRSRTAKPAIGIRFPCSRMF